MANKFSKNDEAVSAVIGVILMVAITVILAAVIAAFVFGMGSSIKKTYVVSLTIDRTSDGNVVVTNTGGPDVSKLDHLATQLQYHTLTAPGNIAAHNMHLELLVPHTALTAPAPSSPTHVIVTGTFKDGTSQVLASADV